MKSVLRKNRFATAEGYHLTGDTGTGHRLGAAFVSAVSADSKKSNAVNHPYLRAMRDGDFPNVTLAFQDFAFQYGLYSARFVRYMSAVTENLSNTEHRKILLANLAEEQGDTHHIELPPDVLDSVVGQPHALLYRRFQVALGVGSGSREVTPECPGRLWSQQFLQLCETNECVGVGAIGIGTELIVANIYDQILEGIKAHSDLTVTQRVFFDLHSECDEEHAAQMLLITRDLAQDTDACEQLEFGIRSAIDMRSTFWDTMLERARNFPASDSPTTERMSAVGYRESL